MSSSIDSGSQKAAAEPDSASAHVVDESNGALDGKGAGLIAVVMVALCLSVSLAALDTTIITTALPRIAEHFNSSAAYTWVGTAYLLASAASTPLWGKLADFLGRKYVLLGANAIFFLGSLLGGLSINAGMIITARAIQGIGSAGLLTLVDVMVGDLFSQRTRGTYLGIIGGTWAVSAAVGPIIGGALTEKVSWRWCFYINLPLDGLAFFVTLVFLRLPTPKTPLMEVLLAIDWAGTLLVTGGSVMLLLGLQSGGITDPWNSAKVICLIVFGVVFLVLFVLVEWRVAKYPLMPLSIFQKRSNTGCFLFVTLHGLVYIADLFFLPLYFQSARGASALKSGIELIPSAAMMGISALVIGAFIGITGNYLLPIWGGILLMTLGFGLYIDFDAESGWAKIIIYQLIAGFGIGAGFQAPLVALQAGIRQRDIATTTATFNFFRQMADAVAIVIGQVVFQNQLIKKESSLARVVGPDLATKLTQGGAAANVRLIDALPTTQRKAVQDAFADSFRPMWIMYTCFSVLACFSVFLIGKSTLATEHVVEEVGLEAEKRHYEERMAEQSSRKTEGAVQLRDRKKRSNGQ